MFEYWPSDSGLAPAWPPSPTFEKHVQIVARQHGSGRRLDAAVNCS
jgi:hypothetical protein